jgi:hypothetical protein
VTTLAAVPAPDVAAVSILSVPDSLTAVATPERNAMKLGIFREHQLPRP